MSDRIAAAEAILATLATARARMSALANAHLPFDRALALELRATVGSSVERTNLEWTSHLLDQNRALWRATRPAPRSHVEEDAGDEATAANRPTVQRLPDLPRPSAPRPVELIVLEPEPLAEALDEPETVNQGASTVAPPVRDDDDQPEVESLFVPDDSEDSDDPDDEVEPQFYDEGEEPDEPVEPEDSELTQQPEAEPARPMAEPDLVRFAESAALEPEPATEESLTEEASEEPQQTNFDYLVRFVEPSRTPPPAAVQSPPPEEPRAPEPDDARPGPEEDGGVVLLSEDDISAPEEDDLLDEAMEKALDGDEPSVVGGQLVFDYAPPTQGEDGGTEGPEDDGEPLLELSNPATVQHTPRVRGAFEEERTLPAAPPVHGRAEPISDEPTGAPPPRRETPRSPAIAFTPVARGRPAPEFNPALEVAAEESDELVSVEPEEPVSRGDGFTVTLERPGQLEPEEEYDDPSDEAPPVNAPRLTDDSEAYETGFDGSGPAQPEVDAGLAAEFLRQARDAELSGNLSKAIMFYQDLLDLTPENMEGYLGRGRCFMEMGDYAAAMSDFQRAEDLDTRSPEPLVEMGNLFFARKEYRRAIEFYDQAIELDPTHAMARCRRGICHHYRKNHKQAFQDLQRAYSLNPDIPNIRKYVQMAVKAMEKPR